MNKEIKKYISSVKRRLNLPKEIRTRLLSDLQTTIEARLEQGEGWTSIRESLGSPARVAAEYTEQMKEFAYRKSPWRFVPLSAAVLCGLRFLYEGAMAILYMQLNVRIQERSVGIIGGADGPTAIFLTATRVPVIRQIGVIGLVFVLCLLIYLRLRKCKRK